MSLLRFVSYAGGALGIAALAWCAVHACIPTPPPAPDSRFLWVILGLLNVAPAGGLVVAGTLDTIPRRKAVNLFFGWAAAAAPILLLDGLVVVAGWVVP